MVSLTFIVFQSQWFGHSNMSCPCPTDIALQLTFIIYLIALPLEFDPENGSSQSIETLVSTNRRTTSHVQ